MATAQKNRYGALYGLAKSLGMDCDNLHEYVYRETGRSSLTELTDPEIWRLKRSLGTLKDGAHHATEQKRTDVGGNIATVSQRRKMYMITAQLGWNGDNRRINRFAKKVTGIERLEWLNTSQTNIVIEALKGMVARGGKNAGRRNNEKESDTQQ